MSHHEARPQAPNQMPTNITDHLHEPTAGVLRALHPEGLGLKDSLARTINTLHRLPHLAIGHGDLKYPEEDAEKVMDTVDFPMNRIVGIASFDSWAGRGLDSKGNAKTTGVYSSAGAIHHYTHNPPDEEYTPKLTLFRDSSGEVWGSTIIDGSHRTAAAKARGDTTLRCTVYYADYDKLPWVDYDVGQEVIKQDRQLRRFTGRIALSREVRGLTVASERVEQLVAAERADNEDSWL